MSETTVHTKLLLVTPSLVKAEHFRLVLGRMYPELTFVSGSQLKGNELEVHVEEDELSITQYTVLSIAAEAMEQLYEIISGS